MAESAVGLVSDCYKRRYDAALRAAALSNEKTHLVLRWASYLPE